MDPINVMIAFVALALLLTIAWPRIDRGIKQLRAVRLLEEMSHYLTDMRVDLQRAEETGRHTLNWTKSTFKPVRLKLNDLVDALKKTNEIRYATLIENLKGLDNQIEDGCKDVGETIRLIMRLESNLVMARDGRAAEITVYAA